jgi:hypothetical protein
MRPSRSALLLLGLLWLACARTAAAQGMHPLPVGPLPLHLRLAESDAVAIGTVAAISDGRIEVRDAIALRGEPGGTFEIKRAPSKPSPIAVGQQAVFLLRGARSPYVLVDDPKEQVVLRDEESARVWRNALAKLLAASGDPEKLLAVYVAWLDGSDETLRASAASALLDARSKLPALAEDAAIARARIALDPARPIVVRRISAHLAATEVAGATALLRGIPGVEPDAQVVETALLRGSLLHSPELPAALDRAFADDDAEIRRRALRVAEATWSDQVAAKVRAIAEQDPDAELRSEAGAAIAGHGSAKQ